MTDAENGAVLTVRRTFEAPRERVSRTFVDPGEIEQWFVPEGMEAVVPGTRRQPGHARRGAVDLGRR